MSKKEEFIKMIDGVLPYLNDLDAEYRNQVDLTISHPQKDLDAIDKIKELKKILIEEKEELSKVDKEDILKRLRKDLSYYKQRTGSNSKAIENLIQNCLLTEERLTHIEGWIERQRNTAKQILEQDPTCVPTKGFSIKTEGSP